MKTPIIKKILHPSDFSQTSETAFVHALKAALISKAALTLIHVSPDMQKNFIVFLPMETAGPIRADRTAYTLALA